MKTNILGVPFDAVTMEEAAERVAAFLNGDKRCAVYTPNPEFVMLARKDREFMRILCAGDMVVPDGIGIVYASKLNRVKIKERVSGYDLALAVFKKIENTGATVYLFGSKPGVAEKAKAELEKKFPGLKIAGTSDGYFDEEKEKIIIEEIKRLKPDLLLVGLGSPRQEKWIDLHGEDLPCKVIIGVGGSLDGYAGYVKRAPDIFIKLNLEWFYRLIKQPSRIKRQIQLPLFALTALKEKIFNGFK